MNNFRTSLITVFIFALIFTLFFHDQDLGLNVFLFEFLALSWLGISGKINFRNRNHLIFCTGVLITAIGVVVTYSEFVVIVNFISFFIYVGVLIYPESKSILTSLKLSGSNVLLSQRKFITMIKNPRFQGNIVVKRRSKWTIFLIPIAVVFFFIIIYRGSNPFFDRLISEITGFVGDQIILIFGSLDLLVVFTFVFGLFISNAVFIRYTNDKVIVSDQLSSDFLVRVKQRSVLLRKKFNGLKDEYQAGIFLLVLLNLTLIIVNALDIYWVWFNFSYSGQYLKQFVHEGTFLLLFSIICSIAVVLYFFRGNLNFYSKNKNLRILSYLWIGQNAILTISVAIRNFHYINYFALAYKRIGLLFFLLLTLYGLYTVYIKVSQKKSAFYLFRTNSLAIYIVLVFTSLFNWETLVVKYNFSHYQNSYIDLKYLIEFPDKTLVFLNQKDSVLSEIKLIQNDKFPAIKDDISKEEYLRQLELRKKDFLNRWKSKSFFSWNLPEYLADRDLK